MQTFFVYTYGTAAWLGLQAGVLILVPKLVLSLLAEDDGHHTSGESESVKQVLRA